MRIALINDIHLGVRNDSNVFVDAHEKFFREIFLPRIKEDNIKDVIILGDLFDRRKYCSFSTMFRVKEFLFDKLEGMGINVHVLVGNHDVAFKNTNRVNSPEILLAEYDNVHIYTRPFELTFFDETGWSEDVGLVPWITLDNMEESLDFLEQTKCRLIFGHFEINGFEMHHNGGVCRDGLTAETFKGFESVFSGHFHEPAWKGNIQYLGSPMQFTWADYNRPRGFNIYDFKTREREFIENTDQMFHKIFYADDVDLTEFDPSIFHERVVRIHVGEKENQHKYDLFIDKIQQVNPYQMDVVDNTEFLFTEEFDESLIENQDTMSIVSQYIKGLDLDFDTTKIEKIFQDLYVEAVAELDNE